MAKAKTTTEIAIPFNHTGAIDFVRATQNVSIAKWPSGTDLVLTINIGFNLDEMRKLTGLQRPGEIAQWLQEQVEALEEMLFDTDTRAHEVLNGYLKSYVEQDREDGRLPNPCGGCHHDPRVRRLAQGRSR